jgi:hypothetical protein
VTDAPFVAAFGPWQGRVLIIVALVVLAFLIAHLPWRLRTGRLDARALMCRRKGFLLSDLEQRRRTI